MRESFGGAFMIKLILVFIVIYVSFMAVAVNYAKAFRVKNNVINLLEQYQYDGSSDVTGALSKVEDYLKNVHYSVSDISCSGKNVRGVCITNPSGATDGTYYRVTSYIAIEFPFFKISMKLPISGETKMIYG